jgi:hypothetical protein
MSYLNALRLTFFGQFQAAVSTVNNDPTHYDNATFQPSYQERESDGNPNGWWNPRGDANWRMIGCQIRSAWSANGQPADPSDPVLRCSIADSDLTVAAKLVDLDPAQQCVSEIWGMQIRIADSAGKTLMRAKYETAAFTDIWTRWPTGSGDGSASAVYQSVLTNIEWYDVESSPFLTQLKAAASDGLLSIKFNVDAFDADFRSPTFTLGRIAGTIGPASAAEPHHFVLGRHFLAAGSPVPGFFTPAGGVNFCAGVVDEVAGKIYLDLGNALATTTMGGPFVDIGHLSLASVTADANGNPVYNPLGEINYLGNDWYQETAGVVALPPDRQLTADELATIAANPLAIVVTGANTQATPAISESPLGLYLRADTFVFRLNPGDSASVQLYATAYGKPYPTAAIFSFPDSTVIGGGPPVGTPADALHYSSLLSTDANGQAVLTITASDPGNPRGYIDGQVFGVRSVLVHTLPPTIQYPFNQWDFVSLLVWDEFVANPPVWEGCLQPVFQQYANLYPIMQRFLDLSNYESICDNMIPLKDSLELRVEDPNYMPVIRDMSRSKRQAILTWLTNLTDGKPLRALPQPAAAPVPKVAPRTPVVSPPAPPDLPRDGKAAALRRVRASNVQRGLR